MGQHEDEQRQLESARKALLTEFAGRVPVDQVERRFADLVAEFEGAPVRTFVPVLVRRRAREQLRTGGA
jgi:hypothetical protein